MTIYVYLFAVWRIFKIAELVLVHATSWAEPWFTSLARKCLYLGIKYDNIISQINATNVTMTFLMQAICGHIWKRILEKTQTNATNATMAPLGQTFWGHIWKHTASENSLERLRFYRSVCEFTGASESKRGFLKFWWSIWDFLGASVECILP